MMKTLVVFLLASVISFAATITIIVKGVKYFFNGDALTSPEQEAILFLKSIDKDAFDE